MSIRRIATFTAVGATLMAVAACNDLSSMPPQSAASGSNCSAADPSYTALTFAGVVCIQQVHRVAQPDGSTEYEIQVSVTDRDPNAFDVTSQDFQLLDTSGNDTSAEPGGAPRAGVSSCVYQQPTDNGWPLNPGDSVTMPGPMCFNVAAGTTPTQLVWQGDVSVPLPAS